MTVARDGARGGHDRPPYHLFVFDFKGSPMTDDEIIAAAKKTWDRHVGVHGKYLDMVLVPVPDSDEIAGVTFYPGAISVQRNFLVSKVAGSRALTSADFPVASIGNRVYCRTQSSPICMAMNDAMATDIAMRLNRDDQCYPGDTVPEWKR
jgi:hypothetical protein